MPADSENPLWQFSLQFYAHPGVDRLCIELQDSFGADVNLVLLCCWAALQGRALRPDGLARLLVDERHSGWRQHMIEPLRELRRNCRRLRPQSRDPVYAALKAAELAAERVEQDRLYRWSLVDLDKAAAEPATLRHNLAVYWAAARLGRLQSDSVQLLVRAAFPEPHGMGG